MIIAFDIGNTNIDVGVFNNDINDNEVVVHFKIKVEKSFSSKYLKNLISEELKIKGINLKIVDTLLLASVRPSIIPKIKDMWTKYFSNSIIEVNNDSDFDLINKYVGNVGVDRILGCLAAYNLYNKNTIVIDLGTATTFNVIDKKRTFYGGLIIPGVYTASQNLLEKTELLYPFTPKTLKNVLENVLANNTADALSNGLFYSNYYAIKGISQKLAEELNFDNYIIIGTGGNLDIFKDTDLFTYTDKYLVLKGLKVFYNRHTGVITKNRGD